MVEPIRHRQTKGAETDMPGLRHVGHPSSSTRDSASRAVPSSIRVRRGGYRGSWRMAGRRRSARCARLRRSLPDPDPENRAAISISSARLPIITVIAALTDKPATGRRLRGYRVHSIARWQNSGRRERIANSTAEKDRGEVPPSSAADQPSCARGPRWSADLIIVRARGRARLWKGELYIIGGGAVHSAVDRGPSRTRKPPTEVRSLDRTASAPLDRPAGVWSSAQAILRANHDQMSV